MGGPVLVQRPENVSSFEEAAKNLKAALEGKEKLKRADPKVVKEIAQYSPTLASLYPIVFPNEYAGIEKTVIGSSEVPSELLSLLKQRKSR